ncbi:hypothetical protein CCMSSC00406_0007641 [Pleurotus cornucopiae]|uniref:Uncharacterized protein n=1 Tax=Pleurotus cornucopiae TaxID=5321 RepID=A0ACB7J3N5_PLECO|nr:hypothetical protein CCMSSC00406_0007641 [Pleurotus cornucopiae]
MAAQVFDLTISNVHTAAALQRVEGKLDSLMATMKVVVEAIGGAEAVNAKERQLEREWAQSLEGMTRMSEGSAEDDMVIDAGNVPSMSDSDEEAAEDTDSKHEVVKGRGKGVEEESDGEEQGEGDEESDEESEEE